MSVAVLPIQGVSWLVGIYGWILILYIFSSFFPQLRHSRVGDILARLSEPYLRLFRGMVPLLGGLDFSPVLALIGLRLVQGILNQLS